VNWICPAQDRGQWWAVVNLQVPQKSGNQLLAFQEGCHSMWLVR
jgi:hypothetical protein